MSNKNVLKAADEKDGTVLNFMDSQISFTKEEKDAWRAAPASYLVDDSSIDNIREHLRKV